MQNVSRCKFVVVLFALVTSLGGCSSNQVGPLGLRSLFGHRDLALAEPLFSKKEEECLNRPDKLLSLLSGTKIEYSSKSDRTKKCDQIRVQFQAVLAPDAQIAPAQQAGAGYSRRQRNEIIDAMLATSNRKCAEYSAYIKNTDGAMNSGLSVAAIVAGGLGGFVGGADTAKALAGSAGILGGTRAALNETYLSNQTIHVLASAYEKARAAQRGEISKREMCEPDKYSLMRGIEDAFAYHASCSLVVGLSETARSVERSDNPGLKEMHAMIEELAQLQQDEAKIRERQAVVAPKAGSLSISVASLKAADDLVTAKQADLAVKQATLDAAVAKRKALAAGADPTSADVAVVAAQQAVNGVTKDVNDAADQREAILAGFAKSLTSSRQVASTEVAVCPF